MSGLLSTPRPVPGRRTPMLAGAAVVVLALLAVTVANKPVGVAAVCVYALAYTLSLGVSLVEYFGGEKLG